MFAKNFAAWIVKHSCCPCLALTRLTFCRTVSSSGNSPLPGYNYGLPGKGKSKKRSNSSGPAVLNYHGEVLYGIHPVILALKAKRRSAFYGLFTDDKSPMTGKHNYMMKHVIDQAQQQKLPVHWASKKILDQLSGNRPHQGVCLDTSELTVPQWNEEEPVQSVTDVPVWLLLHNIQDPMNFGAILRSAHFLGVDRIVIPSINSCRLSPVVSKASAGAMEIANLVKLPAGQTEQILCQWWKSQGGEVVGTSHVTADKAIPLERFAITKPILLLLGNEGIGLGEELEDCCDIILTIPAFEHPQGGKTIDSLNVSVATGIILHWIKQSGPR